MHEMPSTGRAAELPPDGPEDAATAGPAGTRLTQQRSLPMRSLLVLAGIVLAFLIARVPLMFRLQGGADEEWFAAPGWCVAQEGIPRVPYLPSRDPKCAFYRADEALLAMPPAYFYWSAPFFLALPDGYGPARLASAAAALIALWLVYQLGRAFYEDEATALWAVGLYSISRVFYVPAQTARPDMLCCALGLAAMLATWHWHTSGHRRHLVLAGVLLGLGGLTHPFAFAYALQMGAWVLIVGRGWRGRLSAASILVASTLATATLWLPLILAYPEIFQRQFFTNVWDRSGPGLIARLVFPWPSLLNQAKVILTQAQPIQAVLIPLGLVGAAMIDLRRRQRGPLTALALAWLGFFLLAVCQGSHPLGAYLCYPGAIAFICLARTLIVVSRRATRVLAPSLWWAGAASMLLLAMLPGSGIRLWMAYMRHWSDIEYNSPRFVEMVLRDLPRGARLTVDQAYVFDVFLDGRPTIFALSYPFYFDAADFPYDYLLAGPHALYNDVPEKLNGRLLRTYGDKDAWFGCYVEIYRPNRSGSGAPGRGGPKARPLEDNQRQQLRSP